MKKYISIAALCLCMSMQFMAYAEAPCSTGFALGYSLAIREYVTGIADCQEVLLEGPCKQEVNRNLVYTTTILIREFSACCCINGYTECCN